MANGRIPIRNPFIMEQIDRLFVTFTSINKENSTDSEVFSRIPKNVYANSVAFVLSEANASLDEAFFTNSYGLFQNIL